MKERKWSSAVVSDCEPMDCSLPGSSVHGIFQVGIPEWVAFAFSRGSSQPRDRTQVSHIEGRHFTIRATREAFIWNHDQNVSLYNSMLSSGVKKTKEMNVRQVCDPTPLWASGTKSLKLTSWSPQTHRWKWFTFSFENQKVQKRWDFGLNLDHVIIFFLLFFPDLLKYNWHALYKFKMYSIMFWFATSWNDYHDKLNENPSSHIDTKLNKFFKKLCL